MSDIRGEYWIQDGHVDYADGDVGDRNHEGIAIDSVCHNFADQIESLADDMDLVTDFHRYGEVDSEAITRTLYDINEKLQEEKGWDERQADAYIMQTIGANSEAFAILQGSGDARLYMMKYEGWIAVRSNNIELYGYDNSKREDLLNGLSDILDSEGIDESTPPEEIEFSIYDHKTGRSSYITMADIESPSMTMRTNQPPQTTYNKPLSFGTNADSEENKDQRNLTSTPNKWKVAAQKAKIIGPGQDLWRGTSENGIIPFSKWLKLREQRR